MTQDHPSTTDVTLLGRLRQDPKDQAAWSDFVARYGPKILQWCRRWRLQESDAQDVTQDVLLKLNGLMATFVYDPSGSFRGVAQDADAPCLARPRGRAAAGRPSGGGDGRMVELLESLQAGDDLVEQLEDGVPPGGAGPCDGAGAAAGRRRGPGTPSG